MPKQPANATEIEISKLKANADNPRYIKEPRFIQLVKSIKEFPEMLWLRPVVVNEEMVVLGGNMRLRAAVEAGLTKLPVMIAKGLSEEQQEEFIIKDNVPFGEWDWDILGNTWDENKLDEWGLKVPNFEGTAPVEEKYEDKKLWFLNIEFESENDCQKWYEKLIDEGLICKIIQ